MTKIGTRVAAVRNANDSTVYIYGRGVYAGDHPRPGSGAWSEGERAMTRKVITEGDKKDYGWLDSWFDRRVANGEMTREEADKEVAAGRERIAAERAKPLEQRVEELLAHMDLNPRIDLDGGGVVWGFECWWMPEEQFEKFAAGREVEDVEVPS